MATPSSQLQLPVSLDRVQIQALPATAFYIANFLTEEEEQHILQRIEAAPKPRWKHLSHRRLQTWPSDLLHDKLLDAPLPPWLIDPVITRLLSIPVRSSSCSDGDDDDNKFSNIFFDSPHQRPNHVLINEYPPGVGIMPHKVSLSETEETGEIPWFYNSDLKLMPYFLFFLQDGSAYHPVVCTVSLGASLCLNIYKNNEDGTLHSAPVARILQEQRSLLITTDSLYTDYLHGIADIEEDVNLSSDTVANWDLLRSKEPFVDGQNTRQTRVSLTYRDVLKVSKLGNKFGIFSKRP